MKRRSFLANILAAGVAPAAIGSGILMPVKQIIIPQHYKSLRGGERKFGLYTVDEAGLHAECATIAESRLLLDDWYIRVMARPYYFPSIRQVLERSLT